MIDRRSFLRSAVALLAFRFKPAAAESAAVAELVPPPMPTRPKLRAWQINESETYSGIDLEEAIAAAMRDSGLPRDEVFNEHFACEVPGDVCLYCESDLEELEEGEEWEPAGTVGEVLAEMEGPGMVCTESGSW